MDPKKLLARIALAAMTLGTATSAEATAGYQVGAIVEALDNDLTGWHPSMRARMLRVIGRDERVSVRQAAAGHVSTLGLPLSGPGRRLLIRLAADPDRRVRSALVDSVRQLCARARPLEATELVSTLCMARAAPLRLLAAMLLATDIEYVGLPGALEHLAESPEAEVRIATAIAARNRAARAPEAYRRVLARLANDIDPDVRGQATMS